MKRVLITGAGGFVGTHLIHALKATGDAEIFAAVYQATSDITSLIEEDHIIPGDLTDYNYAEKLVAISRPDVIYHLAALSVVHNSVGQAVSIMNSNTTLSYNLLEAVRLSAPKARFIAISSGNVYGAVQDTTYPLSEDTPIRPLNPYAVSKVTQEMLALEYFLAYGLDVVILRPFNHTGVGQTTDFVIPKLSKQFAEIEQGGVDSIIEVGNLATVRDFTAVEDMVKAYILAADKGIAGEIYNIGSGVGHTIKEILDILQSLTPAKVEIKVNEDFVRTSDVPVLIADASKFRQATGWEPRITLSQTISAILENYRLTK
ncbi:MAG: GDP-mannose 4,6-dehydratase [bacterium]